MILISLVFLFVYLFGAYAYGAATVFSIRRVSRVWRRESEDGASAEDATARRAEHGAAVDQHRLVRPAHADRVQPAHRRHTAERPPRSRHAHRLPLSARDHAHGVSRIARRRRAGTALDLPLPADRDVCGRADPRRPIDRHDLPGHAAARQFWLLDRRQYRRPVHAGQHLFDGADAAPETSRPYAGPDSAAQGHDLAVHRDGRRVRRTDVHERRQPRDGDPERLHSDHSHLLPDRLGVFREPLRVLRPRGEARHHDPPERVRARRLLRDRAVVAGDAAGRRGAAVAVCRGAGADRDDHAGARRARRALARSHVAGPRIHPGGSGQARAGGDAAGHRRAVARRGHRGTAQRDLRHPDRGARGSSAGA